MKKTIIIVLVIVLGLGIAAYWMLQKNTEPSVALISPNGGETLKEGSTYAIKWKTQNIPATDKISINIRRVPPPPLQQEGQEFDPIIFINLENTGSKDWKVSDMYPEGDYLLGITSYASIPVTSPVSDESDAPFKIVKSAGWQSYMNEKFGYSVDYPNDWTFREFPDTKTGAGFRPSGSPEDIASECVNIDARGTAENEYDTPFDEYVKIAAPVEIQGFEKLNSIEPVMTAGGLTGYKTTWIYKNFSGQEKISLPIAYFDNEETIQESFGPLKYKTVQISLNSEACEEIYNQMLSTFRLPK
ncbi:MAG: hypothetical protein WC475_00170 [Candidatus Paceibacterota bacterium]